MELNILPYDSTVNPSLLYDATLVEAVKEFQWDHKLKPDGVIGPRGFAILNTSIDERIKEVRATLEKWRWMPRSLGNRYILVNIARQEMQLFENGQIVMSMKTVNGQVLRPTNILFDSIVSVDLNPYWNPPPSLILADIMPKQRANPNHMAEEHVKIFGKGGVEIDPLTVPWNQYINSIPPYQFREEPGINNSLGVVKFQTTNSSAIYLHDTNHREFFDQYDERFLSSGCIRLQHPLDLLQYLLRNKPEWTPEKIDQTLSQPNSYTHTIVPLGRDSIPFYVFYGTASFDDKGNLRFARDAYYLDERIVRAMTPQDEAQ
jgi:murein L,D-transpeptidase YcbB/YkuD